MDLLGIKTNNTKKWKGEGKDGERNIGAVRDAAAVPLDTVDTIRQRVDRGRRKSKKKKSTAGDVVPHPSISILFLFFCFLLSFYLCLFFLSFIGWFWNSRCSSFIFPFTKKVRKKLRHLLVLVWPLSFFFAFSERIPFNLIFFFFCGENETSAAHRMDCLDFGIDSESNHLNRKEEQEITMTPIDD